MTPNKSGGDPSDEEEDGEDPSDTTQVNVGISISVGDDTKSELLAAPGFADFELTPGSMLGEYKIEGKAGEGGMGVVYAAVHPMIGKRAAIKVLKKELCQDPYMVERFIDEARVVNQIGHPNIVDIFAFGEMPNGRSYFVMEWLKGESLRERLARKPLSLVEVCSILRPLARALQAAHDKGIIHRDLKPDNIFLDEVDDDDVMPVKLLDFGIAKLARTEPRLERTATGTMVGTPMYIAPEQARGYEIDHRADIYSLGAIAFELLTRRTPFLADNAMEMVAKHLLEAPPTVGSVNPNVPPALDRIVSQMIQKDPNVRPTLGALITVLEGVKTFETTSPSLRTLTPTLSVSSMPAALPRITAEPAVTELPDDLDTLGTAAGHKRKRWLLAVTMVVLSAATAFGITYVLRDRGSADLDVRGSQPGSSDGSAEPIPTRSADIKGSVGSADHAGPKGSANHAVPKGSADHVVPKGSADHVVPKGSADHVVPKGSADLIVPKGSADHVVPKHVVTPPDRTGSTTVKHVPPPPPPKKGRLVVNLRGATTAEYFIDGKKVGSGRTLDLQLPLGEHELEVRNGKAVEHVRVTVTKSTTRTVTFKPDKPDKPVEDGGLMEPGSIPGVKKSK